MAYLNSLYALGYSQTIKSKIYTTQHYRWRDLFVRKLKS